MKLPKFLNIFKDKSKAGKQGSFVDFFLHASDDDEKKKVFKEAARRANEDQREILRRSGVDLK